eukprot:scaffold6286_cov210-Pinguiococcus_pyrenoidosus.AAC.1
MVLFAPFAAPAPGPANEGAMAIDSDQSVTETSLSCPPYGRSDWLRRILRDCVNLTLPFSGGARFAPWNSSTGIAAVYGADKSLLAHSALTLGARGP